LKWPTKIVKLFGVALFRFKNQSFNVSFYKFLTFICIIIVLPLQGPPNFAFNYVTFNACFSLSSYILGLCVLSSMYFNHLYYLGVKLLSDPTSIKYKMNLLYINKCKFCWNELGLLFIFQNISKLNLNFWLDFIRRFSTIFLKYTDQY